MPTKTQAIELLLIPVIVAGIVWSARSTWDGWVHASPRLEYQNTVDLGERERNEVVIGHFTIGNRGRGELRIDGFATSCSCAGVEREVDGELRPVESIVVPPQEEIQLVVRIAVTQAAGQRQSVAVFFASSDARQSRGQIEVVISRVKGGVYALPTGVLFGEVRVGTEARRVVDLYDNRHAGRRVARVESSRPDVVRARIIPLDAGEPAPVHARAGRLMARLEVTADTSRLGSLSSRIQMWLEDERRGPDSIVVAGEVVYDVECRPCALILPHYVGGKPVFGGQIELRHRDGQSMAVVVDSEPAGMSVKVRRIAERDDQCILDLALKSGAGAQFGERMIRVRVRTSEGEKLVDIPVILTATPQPQLL